MTRRLESLYQRNLNVEKKFKYRAILAILPANYMAPIITILQGLQELGFRVYVIDKSNISSWFTDTVVDDPRQVDFDFVLGSFRWGTRWDHYKKFGLYSRFKVLVDACDNRGTGTWQGKYEAYRKRFRDCLPPEEIAKLREQPYRWVAPLYEYEPDLVFTSQKVLGDKATYYLPFGVHREYLELHENKKGKDREIDFAHIPGTGPRRRELERFLTKKRLPGRVFNERAYGRSLVPSEIEGFPRDELFYMSWRLSEDYFKLLNNTKVLIYPGISAKTAWWDSRRPWEGHASGCLVLYRKPSIDMSQYPVLELCPEAHYSTMIELVDKCNYLYGNQERLERLRSQTFKRAVKYFTPVPLARYFLSVVKEAM